MRTLRTLAFLCVVATLSSLPEPSLGRTASPPPGATIMTTGVASFDAVFSRAIALDQAVKAARVRLGDAGVRLDTVLRVPLTTPMDEALKGLKARAPGLIKIVMTGGKPSLVVTGTAPQDVADGVASVNELLGTCTRGIDELLRVSADAGALAAEAATYPGRAQAEARNAGIAPADLRVVSARVVLNAALVAEIPAGANALVASMQGIVSTVISVFSS